MVLGFDTPRANWFDGRGGTRRLAFLFARALLRPFPVPFLLLLPGSLGLARRFRDTCRFGGARGLCRLGGKDCR
ncbi:MAG: hypothetical protein WB476_05510, partial [Azonexus sp.]